MPTLYSPTYTLREWPMGRTLREATRAEVRAFLAVCKGGTRAPIVVDGVAVCVEKR